jgi:hypothetical protein
MSGSPLEGKPPRQLDLAGSAKPDRPSQSTEDLPEPGAAQRRGWLAKVWMVQKVKELGAKLELQLFRDVVVLDGGKIDVR